MLSQQPFEMHVHVALVGDKTDGAVGQAVGAAHVLYRVAQRQLEDRDQAGEINRRLGCGFLVILRRGDFDEIDAAAGRGLERLVFIGTDRWNPKLN